jgi:phospholipid/cholesterol/gamma-HCH transport system substrate-binding protein
VRAVRVLVSLLILVGIGAVGALGVEHLAGAGTTSGYLVRAVFDNSSFVIPGEEVKVSGVTVGTIHAVQLTAQNKAAVVLQVTSPTSIPFRTDAHCEIGLESLLGEQFVQCSATQPRTPGEPAPPALPVITSGPNAGQHLLPVQNTTTPVGLDLLNNITRLPEQERLRLIIAGLGAGLDANGQELNAALRRADPALQQTDRVIAVLANQNHTLARLTDESAQVLAPLAAQRRHLAGFFDHAGTVAAASAREGQAIQATLRDFPPFLRQLTPEATRLTNLAEQMTPALNALQAQAPAINASVKGLGPLADSSIPALTSLGKVAQRGQTVFPRVYPLARQLLALARPLQPLAIDLAAVSQSFDSAGGIEDVMRFIYYYAGSVNGEDSLGHYIRSRVALGAIQRTSTPGSGPSLSATFACSLVTNACPALGSAASVSSAFAHATTSSRSVPSDVRRAVAAAGGGSTKTAKALLNYLLAP